MPISEASTSAQVIELNERLFVHALIGEYDAALARYQVALDLPTTARYTCR